MIIQMILCHLKGQSTLKSRIHIVRYSDVCLLSSVMEGEDALLVDHKTCHHYRYSTDVSCGNYFLSVSSEAAN